MGKEKINLTTKHEWKTNSRERIDLSSSTDPQKKVLIERERAYKRSVESHHNILKQFLPNKRSKEHIESKTQCQKYSNSHHLHKE